MYFITACYYFSISFFTFQLIVYVLVLVVLAHCFLN